MCARVCVYVCVCVCVQNTYITFNNPVSQLVDDTFNTFVLIVLSESKIYLLKK